MVAKEDVFFRREVGEDRALGNLGLVGDLRHCRRLVTAPGEEGKGSGRDQLASLLLLPFAKTSNYTFVHSVTIR